MKKQQPRIVELVASLLILVGACIGMGPPVAYAEGAASTRAAQEIVSVDRTTFFNEGRYINLEDHESALGISDFSVSGGSVVSLKESGSKHDDARDRSPYSTMQIPIEAIRDRTTGVPGFGFVCDKTGADANGAQVSVSYDYVGDMKDITNPAFSVPVSVKATYTIRDGKTIAEEGDYQAAYNGHPVVHIPLCFSHGVFFCGTNILDTHFEFFNAETGTPLQLGSIYVTATSLNRGEGFALPNSTLKRVYVSNEAPKASVFYNSRGLNTPYQVIPGSLLYDKSSEYGGGYTTIIGCPDIYDKDDGDIDFADTIGSESYYWRSACFALDNKTSNTIDAKVYAVKTADWSGTSGIPGDSCAMNGSMWFATNFMTLTAALPPKPTKTVDKDQGVRLGDTLTYRVNQQVSDLGANSFIRYASFTMSDKLPTSLTYRSARMLDRNGNELQGAGLPSYSEASRTVSFTFTSDYLENTMAMNGESYTLEITADITDYPDDNTLIIANAAATDINGFTQTTDEAKTTLVSPELTIEKHGDTNLATAVNDFEFQPGDIVSYHATVKQTCAKTRAKAISISDTLPSGLALVAGSITALGAEGMSITEDAGGWSISLPRLDYGEAIEIAYQAVATPAGNGSEVINTAITWARNIAPSLVGNEFSVAADDAEIYVNEPALVLTEEVAKSPSTGSPYEHHVGDTVVYTVTLENTAAGTFAKNSVLSQIDLPAGFALAEGEDAVSFDGIACAGSPTQVLYPVHRDDGAHGELETCDLVGKVSTPSDRSGVSLSLNYLPANTPVTLSFACVPTEEVNGMEICSRASVFAENAPTPRMSDPETEVWINSPRLSADKQAPALAYQAGDIVTYHIDIANEAVGTVARNLVIEDSFETPGMELLRTSFVISDETGAIITDRFDIQQNVNEQRWKIETKNPLVHPNTYQLWHTERGGLLVESASLNPLGLDRELAYGIDYQALITDAALAAQQVSNKVTVTSDEKLPVVDGETISVEGPALDLRKTADIGSYHVGDTAQYTLAVTNLRTGTTAHDITLDDALEAGVAGAAVILDDSVEVFDGQMKKQSGWTVTWHDNEAGDHVGFALDTQSDLLNSEKIVVTYKVEFLATTPSHALINTATARAADAPEAKASCSVAYGEADEDILSIKKTSDRTSYGPGDTAAYTLAVKNTGTGPAAINPLISDALETTNLGHLVAGSVAVRDQTGDPIDMARVTYREDGSGELIGFAVDVGADLPAQATYSVVYRVLVSDQEHKQADLFNTARASADNATEVVADHRAAIEDIPPAVIDPLSAPVLGYKTTAYIAADAASGSTIQPGSEITYRIGVRNTGATHAPNVRVRDYLPSGTTYVFESADTGGVYVRSAKEKPAYVEWTLSDLAPEEERTVSFGVKVADDTSKQIVNAARYCATSEAQTAGDSTLPDPERITAKTIHAVSDEDPAGSIVNVVMASIPTAGSAIAPGDTITYTLTATNNGGEAASDVLIRDPIPRGSACVAGSASNEGFVGEDDQQLEWLISSLEPGDSTEVSFRTEVGATANLTSIENQASFAVDASDSVKTEETLENTSNVVEHPYPTQTYVAPKTGDGFPLMTVCIIATLGATACVMIVLACSKLSRRAQRSGIEDDTKKSRPRPKRRSRNDYLMWK